MRYVKHDCLYEVKRFNEDVDSQERRQNVSTALGKREALSKLGNAGFKSGGKVVEVVDHWHFFLVALKLALAHTAEPNEE